jgi:3-hydroxyisobutyrate dehydrogenase
MGRELVAHLIDDGLDVTVWNRTLSAAQDVAAKGARVARTAREAVADAEIVVTTLFGPDAVREVVLAGELPFAQGATWIDVTTVGPEDTVEFADWARATGVGYAYSPVIGSLGPARARKLGVLVGGEPPAVAAALPVVARWADPDRLTTYDEPRKAAAGKLVANVALAVTIQGIVEALRVGRGGGLTPSQVIERCLDKTALQTMAQMKGEVLLGGKFEDTQFSVDALAKDARLMVTTADGPLPALTAALDAFLVAQRQGLGDQDFAVVAARDV